MPTAEAQGSGERARVSVVCAIVSRGGRVLAARRSASLSRGGLWEFPGGKIEAGESAAEALERELHEEFACSARVGEFLALSRHDYGDVSIELSAYRAELLGPIPELRDHEALAWMSPKGLLALDFAPADGPILQALIAEEARPEG